MVTPALPWAAFTTLFVIFSPLVQPLPLILPNHAVGDAAVSLMMLQSACTWVLGAGQCSGGLLNPRMSLWGGGQHPELPLPSELGARSPLGQAGAAVVLPSGEAARIRVHEKSSPRSATEAQPPAAAAERAARCEHPKSLAERCKS